MLKMYLIGALSLVGVVVGLLVSSGVVPVDDRASQSAQYLLVGILLGALFGFLGGFDDVALRLRRLSAAAGDVEPPALPATTVSRLMLFGRFDPGPTTSQRLTEPRRASAIPNKARGSVLPVPTSPADLGVSPATELEVVEAVSRHETDFVDRLVRAGTLTGDGPITDDDVRVMVVTSVISAELSERLLGAIDRSTSVGSGSGPAELVADGATAGTD